MNLLEVDNLNIIFETKEGKVQAAKGLSFSIAKGETLGIVGESGSGKSQAAFSIMGLLAKNGKASGSVKFEGEEILNLAEDKLNHIRAEQISMIFQDPMTSLNPFLKVKTQLTEILIKHKNMSYNNAYQQSLAMLDAVKIPEASKRMNMYPHEFSGGMRQRVMIAMSLLCKPKLLIADEPTTALDVTVQAQILKLLEELKQDFGTAIIMITHDLGVVAGLCDKVLVMYAGQVMEQALVEDIFYDANHPYTISLLQSIPNLNADVEELKTIKGNPPNLLNLPKGCPFVDRCDMVLEQCQNETPKLEIISQDRLKACFWQKGA